MSLFSDLMAGAGADVLLSTSAQQITITPENGVAVTVWGTPGKKKIKEVPGPTGVRRKEESRKVTICKVTGGTYSGVAAVLMNSKFTVDGTDYAVRAIESETDSLICVSLFHSLSMEKTKPSYRRAV
jgi:hypothetical protein